MTALDAGGWCQRWRTRISTWQHRDGRPFDPDRYEVTVLDQQPGRAFIAQHHYLGSWPSVRLTYGLIDRTSHLDDYPDPHPSALTRRGRLVGVAALGIPMQDRVLLKPFPGLTPYYESIELSRLVLLDPVPANAETWMLGKVFRRAARAGIKGVVAFSDPQPRSIGGRVISPGHVGCIYQAHNAAYTGRATPRTLVLLPDGTSLPARAAAKITGQERGWRGVVTRLTNLGATPPSTQDQPGQWLTHALSEIGATTIRHQGNHRYTWQLGRSRTAHMALTMQPYPKASDLPKHAAIRS